MDQYVAIDRSEPFKGSAKETLTRLLKSTVLKGCNIYDRQTVMVQAIDLGALAGRSSSQAGPDFARRFVERFRPLRTKVPGSDMDGRLLHRLGSGAGLPLAEILLEAVVAVETAMAFEQGYLAPINVMRMEPRKAAGEVSLIWSCRRTRISRAAARTGLIGLLEILPTEVYPHRDEGAESFLNALEDLRTFARRRRMAPTTAALVLAASRRGIPCEVLGGPRLRIGHGASQRHVFASVTSKTSFWACRLSSDKRQTNRRLAELGLPVPQQLKVADALEAEEAAERLGFPVVIKPLRGKKGGAVTAGIDQRSHVSDAFVRADEVGSGVIVEECIEGIDHRLLVIGGKFVAATKRTPPYVEGDGELTLKQLIDELNDDPRRDDFRMVKVKIDPALEAFLASKGYALGDVPDKGAVVALRSTANGSTGGIFSDVTTVIHPDNQALAVRAAKAVELDVAGIDFLTTDISRSYKTVGGCIIEINSRPGLRPHTWPSFGEARDVAGAMLDFSMPDGGDGRIPTLLIAGDRGTGPVACELDAILRGADKSVGLVTRQTTFMNGEEVGFDKKKQRRAASILLADPNLEALVSTASLRRTVTRGLTFDRCHAAAIMNRGVEGDVDRFRRGLDVIAKAAGKLVVGAGNAMALEALGDGDPSRLILVSPRLRDAVIERHLSAGGAAVVKLWNAERDRIVLYDNDQVITAIAIDPTVTRSGTRAQARRIEARMFAVALAYSAGMTGTDIEAAIRNAPAPVPRPDDRAIADKDVDQAVLSS